MKFQGPKQIKMRPKWFFGGDAEVGETCRLPYGGRALPATVVWASNGYYRPGFANATGLCRTEAGEYFLAHEVKADTLMDAGTIPAFTLPGGGYWLRIKRLSLRGALLFALQYCDESLRADLLKSLVAVTPSTNATRRFADGSMDVAVHFKPEVARLVRAFCEMQEWTPLYAVYEAVETSVVSLLARGRDADEEMREAFDDHAPGEQREPHPDTVKIAELTAGNKALLRELFALQRFHNEMAGKTFGVSHATLEAAAAYAAKHGRTLDEFIADALKEVAGNGATRGKGKKPKTKAPAPVDRDRVAAINEAYGAVKGGA